MTARLPQPGGDSDNWGQILNDYLSQSIGSDGLLKDGVVSASKLDTGMQAKLAALSGTNSGDQSLSVSGVNLTISGGNTVVLPGGVGSASWGTISGTLGDQADLQTALNARAPKTTQVATSGSLSGGGTLAADRTLSLVNDASSPGANKYYGTNSGSVKGYYTLPTGDPTVGGDLSGTASTAQIVTNAVTYAKLATSVQSSLNKADSALQTAPVTSVATRTGAITLTKSDVGLTNVDNTSDVSKPVSTATQTALNAKANTSAIPTSTSQLTNNAGGAAGEVFAAIKGATRIEVVATLPGSPDANTLYFTTS